MLELPTLGGAAASGTEDGTGFGINEFSVIGGHARDAAGQLVAFTWSAATGITSAGTPGGTNSRAWDINESGQLAGWGRNAANEIVGYRWQEGVGFDLVGTFLPGGDVFGVGINNLGHVAGAIQKDFGHQTPGIDAQSRSFVWNGLDLIDLGLPNGYNGSAANLINDRAQIVGQAFNFDVNGNPITPIAFLHENGVNHLLNDLLVDGDGWHLENARNINNLSQIVGWGSLDGETRGFLLTPVPEPSALALVGAAIAAVVGVGRGLASVRAHQIDLSSSKTIKD
jgi:uncharacterized membrane protein